MPKKDLSEKVRAGLEDYYKPTTPQSSPDNKQGTSKKEEPEKDVIIPTSIKILKSYHRTVKVYAGRTNQNIQDIIKDALDLYFQANGIEIEK